MVCRPEPGLTTTLVTPSELARLIAADRHLGALMLAQLEGVLNTCAIIYVLPAQRSAIYSRH